VSALLDGALLAASPANLLALLAIGLLAGREQRAWLGGILFMVGAVIGSITIAQTARELPGALAQLAVALGAGVLLATRWDTPLFPAGLIWFAGGEALAWNTPPQAITLSGAAASQAGSAIAGLSAFMPLAWLASLRRARWQHIALRIVGSWIAASAILVLALRVMR
jgi:urease accessory protein